MQDPLSRNTLLSALLLLYSLFSLTYCGTTPGTITEGLVLNVDVTGVNYDVTTVGDTTDLGVTQATGGGHLGNEHSNDTNNGTSLTTDSSTGHGVGGFNSSTGSNTGNGTSTHDSNSGHSSPNVTSTHDTGDHDANSGSNTGHTSPNVTSTHGTEGHDANSGSNTGHDSNTGTNTGQGHDDTQGQGDSKGHSDAGGGGHGAAFERYPVAYLKWHHVMYPYIAFLWIIIACVARLALEYNPNLTEFIPESCYMVVLGILIGICLWFSKISNESLSSEHFFIYLLPPVIIEAGYFMPKRAFFDQIGTILWYAIVSTLFSTFSIAFALWGFSNSGGIGAIDLDLDMIHCLTYGGLIAAVDPVAVLATFEEIHVNEILHSIVFGESLLNDGVTVVLFNLFSGLSAIGIDNITAQDIGAGIGSLFLVGIGGTLIGVVVGLIGAFVVRFTEKAPLVQPIIVLTFGYLTYLTPELFNLSAILGCTFGCITLNKYCEPNMSKKSHTTVKYFLKMVAAICETIIFLFLGTFVVNDENEWNAAFIFLNLIFCLVFRSVAVLILTFIANLLRNNRLTFMDQFIMAYGGIRGGIAFALAASMDPKVFPQKNLFMTATTFVIYYTIFVMGITIKPLVMLLKVKKADKHKPSMGEKISARVIDHLMSGIEDIAGAQGHYDLRMKYKHFDEKFMKPFLLRTNARKLHGSILNVYQKLLEKDAMEYIAKNQSFVSQSIPTIGSLSQLVRSQSSSQLLTRRPSAFSVPVGEGSSVLDMRVLDVEEGDKTIDDVDLHHILSENMFRRRRKNTPQNRLMVKPANEHEHDTIIRHKARLHLKTLAKRRSQGMRIRQANMRNTGKKHDKKPKPGHEENHKHDDDRLSCISSGSDGGIVFYVPQNEEEDDGKVGDENEPPEPAGVTEVGDDITSATQTLPWRRESGQEPESSQLAHLVDEESPQKSGTEDVESYS